MPDITLTIDGKEVTVPQGTGVVEAAMKVGIDIPVFCHHPKLPPVGMCRMCLVEVGTPKMDPATKQPVLNEDGTPVIQKMPRLQTACTTPVSQGMQVWSNTAEVEFARKGVLEMLLTSHPLDCPVCVKGGECPLQNLTMSHGPGVSRFDYDDKVHFEKPIKLGPLIDLDRERCILCSRCVRFMDEIAGDNVLGFANRGRQWMIQTKSNPPYNSKFSGNTVDICPVGALMSHEFRFAARVWEVKPVPTVCPHCPVGCNMTLDMRYREIKRVQPRSNEQVNEIWLCDRGRYGHHFTESPERLRTPMVRRGNELVETTWQEALEVVAERMAAIAQRDGGNALGGLAGGRLANEELYLFQKLFREVLQSPNVDSRTGGADDAAHDDLAYHFGVAKGTNLGELGKGTVALVIGADPEEEAPVYVLRVRGIKRRGGEVIVLNGRPTKMDSGASRSVRYRYGTEAQVLLAVANSLLSNGQENKEFVAARAKNVDRLRDALKPYTLAAVAEQTGIAAEEIEAIAKSIADAQNVVVMYGREAMGAGAPLMSAIANLLVLTGKAGQAGSGVIPLQRYNNSRGALDMGVRPDRSPGYGQTTPGMDARQMLQAAGQGRLKAMYVAGIDPAANSPQAQQALQKLELLVVQDLFMTPTAQLADVVLPAAVWAERDGTYTNAERRVQRFRAARNPEAESRPDWQIIATLGRAVYARMPQGEPVAAATQKGKARTYSQPAARPWAYRSTDDVNAEIVREVAIYKDAGYNKLKGATGVWGRQPVEDPIYYDGTSYQNTEGIGVQWPAAAENAQTRFDLQFAAPQTPAQRSDDLTLVGAPRLYNGGTLMQNAPGINYWVANPYVGLARPDAERMGIKSGDTLRISSDVGAIELPALVDGLVQPGAVLIPDVEAAPLGNIQTGVLTPVRIQKIEG